MLRRFQILAALIGLTLLVFASVLMWDSEHRRQQIDKAGNAHLLQSIEQINTRVQGLQLIDFIRDEHLLGDLVSSGQLIGWLAYDEDNLLIQSSSGLRAMPADNTLSYTWYPQGKQGGYVQFILPQPAATMDYWYTDNFVYWLLTLATVMGLIYWQFSSHIKLERFARYLLNADIKGFEHNESKEEGPVFRALNQLMLRASKLEKERQELTRQIRQISYVDQVTGFGNQWFFKAEFEVRLQSRANSERSDDGLLFLIAFKEPEESHDSEWMSDRQVQQIAVVFRHFTQSINNSVVARLKNNEFAILLPNMVRKDINQWCQKLIAKLEEMVFERTSYRHHFIDIGISVYKKGFDYYKVMAEADMALRNAQLQGANSWFIYGEPLSDKVKMGSLRWRSFLQHTLETRQVQLYAQRIHYFADNIKRRKYTPPYHLGILTRLYKDDQLLRGDTFIPMVVQCGMTVTFDKVIIEQVLQLITETDENEKEIFAVKIFADSFKNRTFQDWLSHQLKTCPRPDSLVLEVHEQCLSSLDEQLKTWMKSISELGTQWCVEHFGTPEQELAYLEFYPVHQIKIDRRIIHRISERPAQQLMLSTYLVVLKGMDLLVIAEGVEDEASLNYLRNQGVQAAQGYFFEEPFPLTQLKVKKKAV